MAQTTVRMVFYNPNPRPLEGNLQFPLLEGQQITEFALDIDGKLRPAVTVEKAKGRQIFEEIERRNVDPALLERTQGNNFKLRIYPIAAMGTRTVELKYAEAMTRVGKHWSLPLGRAAGRPEWRGCSRSAAFHRGHPRPFTNQDRHRRPAAAPAGSGPPPGVLVEHARAIQSDPAGAAGVLQLL